MGERRGDHQGGREGEVIGERANLSLKGGKEGCLGGGGEDIVDPGFHKARIAVLPMCELCSSRRLEAEEIRQPPLKAAICKRWPVGGRKGLGWGGRRKVVK